MPTLVLFLAKLGLVSARFLIKNMKYAILIMFIVGAVLSPGTDPVGQIAMAGPMFLLYLLSILLAWLFGKKRAPARGVIAGEVARLLEQLSRLRLRSDARPRSRGCACIGARAMPALVAFVTSGAAAGARAAALAALEGSDDARAVAVAREALAGPTPPWRWPPSACCAAGSAQEQGTEALEALTVAALDRERDSAVRLAALDALSDLPAAPGRADPRDERPGARRTAARRRQRGAGVAGRARAPTASLATVHERAVGRTRGRAARPPRHAARTGGVSAAPPTSSWRGAGSRLALYDLRDTFGTATAPLPLDFLTAVTWWATRPASSRWRGPGQPREAEPWWRARLVEAAADIIASAGLTGRHASVKRLATKWPEFHAATRLR